MAAGYAYGAVVKLDRARPRTYDFGNRLTKVHHRLADFLIRFDSLLSAIMIVELPGLSFF
jgi:hypothetical protein